MNLKKLAAAFAILMASGAFWVQGQVAPPVVVVLPTQVVCFGNSLDDQGNIAGTPDTNTPAQSGMGIGGVWVQQLAGYLSYNIMASNKGGTNYAQAGAVSGKSPNGINMVTQVNNYIASTSGKATGTASPTAVYAIFGGSNDIINDLGNSDINSVAVTAADNIAAQINSLIKVGGQNFLWLNMIPLDLTPRYYGTSSAPQLAGADTAFNNEWSADIASLQQQHPSVTIIGIDLYSLTLGAYNNPSMYGFTDVTDAWTTAPKTIMYSAHASDPNSDKFLSWDGLHPTTRYHQVMATTCFNALPGVVLPSALTGLGAAPGAAKVSLSWNSTAMATSYAVCRATGSGAYSVVKSGVTGTSYIDTGLTNGTTYNYCVVPINANGQGLGAVVTCAPVALPGAPPGLTVVPYNAGAGLTWMAATGATTYNVMRSNGVSGPFTTIASGLTATNYVDTGLTNGVKYYYLVAGVNVSGVGPNSTEVNVKPAATIPLAPTNLSATGKAQEVDLTWTASANTRTYNVKRSTTSGGPYTTVATGVTTTSYHDTGLPGGATYFYVVSAVNTNGESANSTEASALTLFGAVTGLAVVPNSDQVTLTWNAMPGATSYTVARSTVSGGPYTTLASGVASTTYTDTGLTNGTAYYYVIIAVNANTTGPNSAEIKGLPAAQNLYWDTTTAAGLANGSGNWDTGITQIWSNSSAGTSNPLLTWLNDDNALFQTGGALTATIATGTTVIATSVNQSGIGTAATITGGTLQIDTNAGITNAVGGGNSALIINSALVLNSPNVTVDNETTSGSIFVNGVIAETGGSRAITKTGVGVLSFSQASTFSGGLTITAGQVTNGVNSNIPFFGTGAITLAGAGTASPLLDITNTAFTFNNNFVIPTGTQSRLEFSETSSLAFNGTMTGGGLLQVSSGLNVIFQFNGDLTQFTGTLQFVGNGASSGTTTYYDLDNTTAVGAPLAAIRLDAGADSTNASNVVSLRWNPTTTTSATIPIGALTSSYASGQSASSILVQDAKASTTATFQVGGLGTSGTFNGTIKNGNGTVAIDKVGVGAWTLSGSNIYTGTTTVDGGTLIVTSSLAAGSAVTVNSAGTLGGPGTIKGPTTVASGGTLAPGLGGVATLSFANGLSLNAGSVLTFDLGPTSASDEIIMSGSYIAPAGGTATINLNALAGFGPGTYTLIAGANGINASNFKLGAIPAGYGGQILVSGNSLGVTVTALPAAPTGLAAVPFNAQVNLTWMPSTGASTYNVLRSTTSGGPYTTIATGLTTTSYTDNGVTNGTTYYYVVAGVNAGGVGPNSTQVSALPQSAIPAPPTNLAAMGAPLEIDLTWTASTGASTYNVKRSSTSGGPYATIATGVTLTSYHDTGLPGGATYYYVVSAVNANGESANSSQSSATAILPVPAMVTGLAAAPNSDQVTLTWSAATNAATYTVERSLVSGGPYTTIASGLTVTTYTDVGLSNGTSYYYVVAAVNASGTGPISGEVSGAPLAQPLYWDTTTAAGLGNGSGNWDTGVTPIWSNSSAGTSSPLLTWLNDDIAFFQTGGAFTATIATGATVIATSINQSGTGTATTITGGTLEIDSNAGITNAIGGGNGALTINSVVALNSPNVTVDNETTGGNILLNGVVAETGGSRAMTKIGGGVLGLTKANTFSGGLTITAGQVTNGVNSNFTFFGTGPITLAGTGTAVPLLDVTNTAFTFNNNFVIPAGTQDRLEYSNSSSLPFNGSFTGSGFLQISSGLNVIFQFNGDLTQFSGTLEFAGNGATSGTTTYYDFTNTTTIGARQATIQLDAGADSTNASNVVSLRWNPATTTSATIPIGALTSSFASAQSTANIILQDAKASTTATFQIGELNTSGTFNGTIKNGNGVVAIDKVGTGALTLSGSNVYTGTTTVDGGTLIVSSSLAAGSALTVNSAGTLGGSGTIKGPATVASGGTLAPGQGGVATLTFSGGLTLNSGSVLTLDLGAAPSADRIALTGSYTAPASGTATINLNALAGFGPGTYTLITGATGITTSSFSLGAIPAGYGCQLNVSGNVLSVTATALPAAPTGLAAVPFNAQVNLTWMASTGASTYNVLRSTISGGPYTTIATGLTTTSYTDNGVTNGTTYYYVVAGVNTGGVGPNSSEISAVPQSAIPAPPTNLAATGAALEIDLTWTASTGASSYNVKRSSTSGGPYTTLATGVTTTSYSDTGLPGGATYYYVVSAVNTNGESANSSQSSATAILPVPAMVTGLAAAPNSDQVTLTWSAVANAASYTVERALVTGGPYTTIASGVTAVTYTDTALINGTTYYYVVAAVNASGTGPISTEVSGTPTAQNLYWDTTTAVGLANGNGNWDTGVTPIWSNSSAGTSNPLLSWLSDDNAYFQTGGAFTATIATGTTVIATSVNQSGTGTAATITGGTLEIDSNAGITNAIGGGDSALTINSVLALNSPNVTIDNETTTGNIVLNGIVAETGGSRAMTKIGAGILSLTKANTFSGGFIIAAGQVTNGVNSNFTFFGTGPITLAGAGTVVPLLDVANTAFTFNNNFVIPAGTQSRFEYSNSSALPFNGSFTGGGFLQVSSGLTPTFQFNGDLTQFAGTFEFAGNGATSGTTTNYDLTNTTAIGAPQATIQLDAGVDSTNASNVVSLRWNPTTTTSATIPIGALTSSFGSAQTTANIALQDAKASTTATFQIGALGTSGTFNGTIKNGNGVVAIDKVGTGGLTLSGSNVYTGTTTVNGGTLIVTSSLAAGSTVTVNPAGTLAGSGTIKGLATVASGGTLAPGQGGVATLTFSGGLTLNSGSVLTFDLGAAPSSDRVALTGSYTAPASGTATINLNPVAGFGNGTYTLITGATGISASSFTLGTIPAGYGCQLSVTGNSLAVIVTAFPGTPTGLTATPYNSEVDLTWTAASGATSYTVMRSNVSGGPYTTIATGVTTPTYIDAGLTNGTAYYYVVEAVNAGGTSGNSNEATTTPVANAIADPWTDADIGSVAQAGSSTYSAGVYTLNGSGTGIGGTADGFDYTYQPLVGDGTIIAHVASQSGGESGVVVRETLDAGARYVDLLLQVGVGAQLQYRTDIGGATTTGGTVTSTTAPYWVKLSRAGNTFVGYISPDGVTWTQVRSITDAMAGSVYVGLAQSSVTNTSLTTGTFDNVNIVPTSAYSSQDIGPVQVVGASYYSSGVATINGSGADIGGTADQFRYTCEPASGNCDITARVTAVGNTDPSAKAGVMIRESLAVGATHASVYVTPGNGVLFQWRNSTNGATGSIQTAGLTAPSWVRLSRTGSSFTASYSPDGTTWTTIGSQSITMATAVYIGLPVCSHNSGAICTATLDNITADP